MVEQVEQLDAELQLHPLLDGEVSEQRVIDVDQPGPVQEVSALVAIGEDARRWKGVGGGRNASGQVRVSAIGLGRADQVRTVGAAGGGVGGIGPSADVER